MTNRSSLIALVLAVVALPAAAGRYELAPGDDVIGAEQHVRAAYEDTLLDIGRRYGVGYEEMQRANPGVDVWLPGEGTEVRVPTRFVLPDAARSGIVVNVAEFRLYYFSGKGKVRTVASFPISIGRMDWTTPLGRASVVSKLRNPAWYPPKSVREEYAREGRQLPRIVPAGPDNPLGAFALRLSVPGYLIHGTNRPAGVGMRVTHGCIRLFPEDIAWLFPRVPLNTAVQLVNQPYKLGWLGDELWLEVHPPLDEDSDDGGLTAITSLYVRLTHDRPAQVDWSLVEQAYDQRLGVPVRIGRAEPHAQPTQELAAAGSSGPR